MTPTNQHLIEFKKVLFEDIYQKDPEQHIVQMENQLDLQERISIRFPLHLKTAEDIQNLLKMTPFFWRSSKEKQKELLKFDELQVTIDVVLWIFKLPMSYNIS